MSPTKITAIFLVMAAGVIGSYFIIKNFSPSTPGAISGNGAENKSFLSKPIRWITNTDNNSNDNNNEEVLNASDDFVKKISENADVKNSDVSGEGIGNINLTQMAAQSLFGRMKMMDQKGENPFQNFNPNDLENKNLVEQIISGQNPMSLFISSINDKEIKISNDNSRDNKNNYLENAASIVLTNPYSNSNPIPALDNAIKYGDTSDVLKMADSYQATYNQLINLTTPSSLADIHRRYLIFLKNIELTYRGIAQIRTDGVKAGLYLEALPQLLTTDANLRKEIYNLALELNSDRL